jgi:hypothetical protein
MLVVTHAFKLLVSAAVTLNVVTPCVINIPPS